MTIPTLMPDPAGRHTATIAYLEGHYLCAGHECGTRMHQESFYREGGRKDAAGNRWCRKCVAAGYANCMPDPKPGATVPPARKRPARKPRAGTRPANKTAGAAP